MRLLDKRSSRAVGRRGGTAFAKVISRRRCVVGMVTIAVLASTVGCVSSAKTDDAAQMYQDMLSSWYAGYWFWRITYTVLSVAAVTLPALVAAGIWSDQQRNRALAAAAASIIAVTSFMQAGEKASAHAHAYLCMRLAMASYRAQLTQLSVLNDEAKKCAQHISYEYLDPRTPT